MESQCRKDPEEMGGIGSSPTHSPSWSPARGLPPNCPNTMYCLGIHVTLTKETGAVPPPSHAWRAPLVEDMLCYARTGLTKAMITAQVGQFFFMRDVLWERALVQMSLGMLAFVLTGVGTWVGKPAYLTADPLTIQEGQWEIAWAKPNAR